MIILYCFVGFSRFPLSANVTIGMRHEFFCEYPGADGFAWRVYVNETYRNIRELSDVHSMGNSVIIPAFPWYNATTVECVALFYNECQAVTPSALLLIQGISIVDSQCCYNIIILILGQLDAVKDLDVENFTIIWRPPFSLNLTNANPDIVYCVDMYNVTCGRKDLIISDCNVTEPSYTSDDIAPDGYIYEYIITPRSNVEGARNGTPSQPMRSISMTLTHMLLYM